MVSRSASPRTGTYWVVWFLLSRFVCAFSWLFRTIYARVYQLHPPSNLCRGISCCPVWWNFSDKWRGLSCPPCCYLPVQFSSLLPFLLVFVWPTPMFDLHHSSPDTATWLGTSDELASPLKMWSSSGSWSLCLTLPKVLGGCNSILHCLQAASEVAANYQVTLSATRHCAEPVVQLALDQDCWPHLFIMFSAASCTYHIALGHSTHLLQHTGSNDFLKLCNWSSWYLRACRWPASCTGFAALSLSLHGNWIHLNPPARNTVRNLLRYQEMHRIWKVITVAIYLLGSTFPCSGDLFFPDNI